jgi:hypothetical protein
MKLIEKEVNGTERVWCVLAAKAVVCPLFAGVTSERGQWAVGSGRWAAVQCGHGQHNHQQYCTAARLNRWLDSGCFALFVVDGGEPGRSEMTGREKARLTRTRRPDWTEHRGGRGLGGQAGHLHCLGLHMRLDAGCSCISPPVRVMPGAGRGPKIPLTA